MSVTTDDGHALSAPVAAEPSLFFPLAMAALLVVNASAFLYGLSGLAAFGMLGNAVSLALICYALYVVMRGSARLGADMTFLLVATSLVMLSIAANIENVSPVVAVKYLALYVFYAAGRRCGGGIGRFELRCVAVLALLPLVFMALGTSRIYNEESFAYLPNANTAVLYYTALLFAVAARFGFTVLVLQFVLAALMQKVGAAVATVGAISLWALIPPRRGSLPVAVAISIFCIAGYLAGAFDRIAGAFAQIEWIARLSPAAVSTMSYGELVTLVGSTDVSTFFRLVHWASIWEFFSSGGFWMFLFGYGAGQTDVLFGLEPHNDYLRVLAEFGALNLIVFIGFLGYVIATVREMAARVLLGVLMIYFCSENLIDNFTSMALFFGYAGSIATQAQARPRPM